MICFYLNVESINGQFNDQEGFNKGINIFLDTVNSIQLINGQYRIIFCKDFYAKRGIYTEDILTSIKRDKDLNWRFLSIIQTKRLDFWNSNPIQDFDSKYHINDRDYSVTIVAEAIEEVVRLENRSILINFIGSVFGDIKFLSSIKQQSEARQIVNVNCTYSANGLISVLSNLGIPISVKRIFEHNPKHHINANIEFASPLKCTHEKAQHFLNEAIQEQEYNSKRLYNFDPVLNEFIIFNCHEKNKYHAYYEPNRLKIPNVILNHFNL
jgi:hypothetical protein